MPCHPERSEGPDAGGLEAVATLPPQVLRYAQDDKARLVVRLSARKCKEDTRSTPEKAYFATLMLLFWVILM